MSGGFSIIPNSNTDPKVNLNNSDRELMNLSFVNVDSTTDVSNNILNLACSNNDISFHDLTLSSSVPQPVSITGDGTDFSLKEIVFGGYGTFMINKDVFGANIINSSSVKITNVEKFIQTFNSIITNIIITNSLTEITPYDDVTIYGAVYNISGISDFRYESDDYQYLIEEINYIENTVSIDDTLVFNKFTFENDGSDIEKINITNQPSLLDAEGNLYTINSHGYRPTINIGNIIPVSFTYVGPLSESFIITSAGIYSTSNVITLSTDTLNINCNDFTAGVADIIFSVKSTLSTLTEILININDSTFHFTAVQNAVLTIKLRLLNSSGEIRAFVLN